MNTVVFTRNKKVTITHTESGMIVSATMQDNNHKIEAVVEISFPEMSIIAISGDMIRVPRPECHHALGILPKAIGLEIKKGLTLRMEEAIGGNCGCAHLTNLVMEACHASIQGQYTKFRESFSDILDAMSPDERTRAYLDIHPSIVNTCVVFREDSEAIREARNHPETYRIVKLKEQIASHFNKKPIH